MKLLVIAALGALAVTVGAERQQPPAAPARPALPAESDPVVGNWRGTLKSAQGGDSSIIITIVKKGDVYTGSTNGINAASEVPLKRVAVTGNHLTIEAASESRLGDVVLAGELTAEGASMTGVGTLSVGAQKFDVTLAFQRRLRAEVIQPRVEQRAEYFVGRWNFEYVGAEYPPISTGTRTGVAVYTSDGSNFVSGRLEVEAGSRKYQVTEKIGFDPETNMVVLVERRSDGFELASLGNWRSPIAITLLTSPVKADGKTCQLRRVIHVTSDTAYELTEELSVDGGAFKRLGSAHYTKQP